MKVFTYVSKHDIDSAVTKRIEEMESPRYQFPERFSKKDYIIAFIAGGVCLFMIVVGYFL